MFLRMLCGALTRQWKKMLMIAFTIALGASLATAMLGVMMDVGDKVNQELKAYGANIRVVPKESSIVNELYDMEDEGGAVKARLSEDELGNIKTIFWAFNIVDYTPFLETEAQMENGESVALRGSWFNHHLSLPTGEELDAGIRSLRSWWDIVEGEWLDEQSENAGSSAMIGVALAEKYGLRTGDTLTLHGEAADAQLNIVGVFDAGDEEDEAVFVYLDTAQELAGLPGAVDSIEVSALTTPDNELSEKWAKNPSSLSQKDYETWYCTAYASSICYQIQEVITDSVASPVRQVADSEGEILNKTQLLMILITILSLIGAALGICNLVTASVMERSQEIGLMKAIGAQNGQISALVLSEIMVTALIGGVAGFFAGMGFAQIIGHTVFNSAISLRAMVVPIVAVLVVVVTLIGSIPAIKMLLGLRPTEVLHGR